MWLNEEGNLKYKNLKFCFKLTTDEIAGKHGVLRTRFLCKWSGVRHCLIQYEC